MRVICPGCQGGVRKNESVPDKDAAQVLTPANPCSWIASNAPLFFRVALAILRMFFSVLTFNLSTAASISFSSTTVTIATGSVARRSYTHHDNGSNMRKFIGQYIHSEFWCSALPRSVRGYLVTAIYHPLLLMHSIGLEDQARHYGGSLSDTLSRAIQTQQLDSPFLCSAIYCFGSGARRSSRF